MKDKKSRFTEILKSRQAETPPRAPKAAPDQGRRMVPAEPDRRPGRPAGKGKRLNPDFAQVTAYIPAQLHTQTKINLLRLPEKKEFSELVDELLVAWNHDQESTR